MAIRTKAAARGAGLQARAWEAGWGERLEADGAEARGLRDALASRG